MARCKRAEEIKCKAGEKRILEENDGICNGAAAAGGSPTKIGRLSGPELQGGNPV